MLEPVWENELRKIGLHKISGSDECAKGPLFGPVITASVMLPPGHKIEGLRDSKKLSPKRRAVLAELIYERAIDVRVCEIPNLIIDQINILEATKLGIKNTIETLKVTPDIALIDGFFKFESPLSLSVPYNCRNKAEDLSENVAAASIICKHYHTEWIKIIAPKYPEYSLNEHKGYGTKKHVAAILKYGPTPLHRKSFRVKGVLMGEMII